MREPPAAHRWVVDLTRSTPPFVWEEIFPVPVRSVELEIGSGKGMFLRQEAQARPDVGFLGVEHARKWFALCAARLARDGRPNVRVVHHDAFDLLVRWIPPGSLDAVDLLFPDPWPKKRHAKRRLLAPPLFDLVARALRQDGKLVLATDAGWYFEEAMEHLVAHPCFERLQDLPSDEESIRTNYALKYARQGRGLYSARFRRNRAPAPPVPPPPSRRRSSAK